MMMEAAKLLFGYIFRFDGNISEFIWMDESAEWCLDNLGYLPTISLEKNTIIFTKPEDEILFSVKYSHTANFTPKIGLVSINNENFRKSQ